MNSEKPLQKTLNENFFQFKVYLIKILRTFRNNCFSKKTMIGTTVCSS